MLVPLAALVNRVVKVLICSLIPSACASSVVKPAGTGPSSAVTDRGAGAASTGSSCSASFAGSTPVPSTDGTTLTEAPEISNPASFAGVPNADSPSPNAAWSAVGSIETPSSPLSSGVKAIDAAIAATGTSAEIAPSWLTTATGADTAGR